MPGRLSLQSLVVGTVVQPLLTCCPMPNPGTKNAKFPNSKFYLNLLSPENLSAKQYRKYSR